MYVRFTTHQRDEDTGIPVGVFSAAYELLYGAGCDEYFRNEIHGALDWFDINLPKPSRIRRSRMSNRQNRGICWFKPEAAACLSRIRYLVYLFREQGIVVREVTTDLPGYRIYEDEHQIVAEPFSMTLQ